MTNFSLLTLFVRFLAHGVCAYDSSLWLVCFACVDRLSCLFFWMANFGLFIFNCDVALSGSSCLWWSTLAHSCFLYGWFLLYVVLTTNFGLFVCLLWRCFIRAFMLMMANGGLFILVCVYCLCHLLCGRPNLVCSYIYYGVDKSGYLYLWWSTTATLFVCMAHLCYLLFDGQICLFVFDD